MFTISQNSFITAAAAALLALAPQPHGRAEVTGEVPADIGIASEFKAWGGAAAQWSQEYLYEETPALKMVFPTRESGIWFTPKETDWTPYAELVFTLYNPWNEPKNKALSLRQTGESRPKKIPQNLASLPHGTLSVPRETRVTVRIDLTDPVLLEQFDLSKINGIHIGAGSKETTLFLDSFQFRTHAEVASEKRTALVKNVGETRSYLSKHLKKHPPTYKKPVRESLAALEELLQQTPPPKEDVWRPVITRASELAVALEALAHVPTPESPLEILPALSADKIFRDEPIPLKVKALELEAAGNERTSFQAIVIPREPLHNVRVEPLSLTLDDDPATEISPAHVTIHNVGYVEVTNAIYYKSSRVGWWPDPLLPSKPLDIVERLQPFWITVSVPPQQKPGLYRGKLKFIADRGIEQTLHYQLRVWGFSLPKRGKLQTVISFTYKPSDEAVRRACYSTLLDHRISPINIYINGSVQQGYQPERSDLKFCLDRGLNTIVLWNPYNPQAEFPYDFDDAYLHRMNSFIADYKQELLKEDAWKMSMVLGFDEITHQGKEYAERASQGAERLLSSLKENFPDLHLANIGGPPIPSTLQGPGNIWIPQTSIAEPAWEKEFHAMRQQEGSKYFFYWVYGDPSFMLDLPGIAPRCLSWIAFKYGAKGIGYYSTIRSARFDSAPEGVDWPHELYNVETTNRVGRNSCGSLVYPARDKTILPSIRLANTRDGIQDYEYLAILQELVERTGDQEAAQLLNLPDALLTTKIYPKDAETLLSLRRQVAHAIERLQQSLSH